MCDIALSQMVPFPTRKLFFFFPIIGVSDQATCKFPMESIWSKVNQSSNVCLKLFHNKQVKTPHPSSPSKKSIIKYKILRSHYKMITRLIYFAPFRLLQHSMIQNWRELYLSSYGDNYLAYIYWLGKYSIKELHPQPKKSGYRMGFSHIFQS